MYEEMTFDLCKTTEAKISHTNHDDISRPYNLSEPPLYKSHSTQTKTTYGIHNACI